MADRTTLTLTATALALFLLVTPLVPAPLAAQVPNADIAALEGLAMPERPETMATNAEGQITIRAYRIDEPLELDGALDEEIYQRIDPASGFVQWEPERGPPATDDTELWVFYDDENLYLAFRAHSEFPEQIVANEMRRDHRNVWENENIIVSLDTFLDRRSAVFFQTNALGAVRDGLVIDENTRNFDWNTIWDVRSRRTEGGWTSEMEIPFESLQYDPGTEQVWGINVHRAVRSKNEFSILSPPPESFSSNGAFRMASAATLVGLEAPSGSNNLEFRPYAISTLTTDRPLGISNDVDADLGIDASYGITNSITLDLTYNTDFAQVEIDEQQVNLTRFSLLFPEKRDFFLEGQSVFDFAGPSGGGPNQAGPDPTPFLFFSRRIGIAAGQAVPIDGGGRLMGRAGPVSVGLMSIQTGSASVLDPTGSGSGTGGSGGSGGTGGSGAEPGIPSTNFSVARIKTDVFERSSIGALATYRDPALGAAAGGGTGGSGSGVASGENLAYGVDANLSPAANLWITGYYARTRTEGVDGGSGGAGGTGGTQPASDPESYLTRIQYDADRYGVRAERLKVGGGFDPQVGFLRRRDFVRHFLQGRISRRPESVSFLRRWSVEGAFDHYENSAGVLETQQERAGLRVELQSSDQLSLDYSRNFEFLAEPFSVAGGGTVAPGEYRFHEVSARFQAGPHRWLSGSVNASYGGFYDGNRARLGYQGRAEFGPRFAVEPRVSVDWVDLPGESYRVTLLGARPTLNITPRNFVSALIQYNSAADAVETNVRWRWELEPGTILYVVYTDARYTGAETLTEIRTGDPLELGSGGLLNRSLAVKFTRLLRF